jgi:hypothetical protein
MHQIPFFTVDLLELTEENGEEGEDEVNETMEFPCSTGIQKICNIRRHIKLVNS